MGIGRLVFGGALAGGALLLLRRRDFGIVFGPPARGLVSSGWGDPRDGGARFHRGIDIRGELGDPVFAAASGVVQRVAQDSRSGLFIELAHGGGDVRTEYAHLGEALVSAGARVGRGAVIGRMGRSGVQSAATHLHFEVEVCSEGLARAYEAQHGAPTPGIRVGGCAPVPAEAIVPLDGFFDRVVSAAAARGVPLRG